MHFQNHRKSSLKTKKQTKPCPYHSRVSSTVESGARSISPYSSTKSPQPLAKNNKRLPIKLPKLIESSRILKTEFIPQPYSRYGERLKTDFNYYEDMKLSNEGWPSNAYFGKMHYAKHDDIAFKARQMVNQIYSDQFYSVRKELEIIRRVRQRYEVIRNIQEDKQKLKLMLRKVKNKKIYVENYADSSEQQNQ